MQPQTQIKLWINNLTLINKITIEQSFSLDKPTNSISKVTTKSLNKITQIPYFKTLALTGSEPLKSIYGHPVTAITISGY